MLLEGLSQLLNYSDKYRCIDFRKHPEKYDIGRGEQGVLLAEPYKSEILPHWRFAMPEKAVEQLSDIRDKKQEYFLYLTLDGANHLIAKRIITIGTLTASLVHPREVFAEAITDRAASIIVAHNHPSGNLEPSQADREVTERLRDAGDLLGVKLIDHIVVTKDSYSSIA